MTALPSSLSCALESCIPDSMAVSDCFLDHAVSHRTFPCLGENWFQSDFFPLQVFCFHVRMADVLRYVSECGEPVFSVPGGHVHWAAGI